MSTPHQVQVNLNNPDNSDFDLALRDEHLGLIAYSTKVGNGVDEYIATDVLPAGKYFVQVRNSLRRSSDSTYELQVEFE